MFVIGCDGPAEQAGENLDTQVASARAEVTELKQQIEGYKLTIQQTKDELAASKEQLTLAQKELEETKHSRDQILYEIEKLQQNPHAESNPQSSP